MGSNGSFCLGYLVQGPMQSSTAMPRHSFLRALRESETGNRRPLSQYRKQCIKKAWIHEFERLSMHWNTFACGPVYSRSDLQMNFPIKETIPESWRELVVGLRAISLFVYKNFGIPDPEGWADFDARKFRAVYSTYSCYRIWLMGNGNEQEHKFLRNASTFLSMKNFFAALEQNEQSVPHYTTFCPLSNSESELVLSLAEHRGNQNGFECFNARSGERVRCIFFLPYSPNWMILGIYRDSAI
jgi:hypothetical protein